MNVHKRRIKLYINGAHTATRARRFLCWTIRPSTLDCPRRDLCLRRRQTIRRKSLKTKKRPFENEIISPFVYCARNLTINLIYCISQSISFARSRGEFLLAAIWPLASGLISSFFRKQRWRANTEQCCMRHSQNERKWNPWCAMRINDLYLFSFIFLLTLRNRIDRRQYGGRLGRCAFRTREENDLRRSTLRHSNEWFILLNWDIHYECERTTVVAIARLVLFSSLNWEKVSSK